MSFSPIGPGPLLIGGVAAVTRADALGLSRGGCSGTSGGWRWVALSLRLLAILLCLLAALRPSVVLKEKKRQAASLVFLVDSQHEHDHRRRGRRPDRAGPSPARRSSRRTRRPRRSAPTSTSSSTRSIRPLERAQGPTRRPSPSPRAGRRGSAPRCSRPRSASSPERQADRPDGDPLRLHLEQRR